MLSIIPTPTLMMKKKAIKSVIVLVGVTVVLALAKVAWVLCATSGQGTFEGEKKEIIKRANYLTSKVATTPQELLDEMASGIGAQFQGEWALYSCSMTTAALANIAILYPQNKDVSLKFMAQMIDIALSPEIREYDTMRWMEDAMDGIDGRLMKTPVGPYRISVEQEVINFLIPA